MKRQRGFWVISKRGVLVIVAMALLSRFGPAEAQPHIRIDGNHTVSRSHLTVRDEEVSSVPLTAPSDAAAWRVQVRAWQGEPSPGGGTLNLGTLTPPAINRAGLMAFVANIEGSQRNQGIFVADSRGVRAIVVGCGGGGGSGDPGWGCGDRAPVGGTFSGFFSGPAFAPAINGRGDVLFLADVYGGISQRGLFLYRAATRQIMKVAAVGDPSPLGGVLSEIGPGSLNDRGEVAFLAGAGAYVANIFVWRNGVVSKHAAVGDPAPEGGVFDALGTEWLGFVDGTSIPTGPVPDINNAGQISFRAIVSGGTTERGMIVSTGGEQRWYARRGDPTPAGGTYLDFWAPILNDAGEIAFMADFEPTPGEYSAGWFAGSPGAWRKALAFYDPIDGQPCWGLAVSRNPMQPLDADGDLLIWCSIQMADGSTRERLVISHADGSLIVVAREADPSPMGGTLGEMEAWPSLVKGRGTLSASMQGGSAQLAHMVFLRGSRETRVLRTLPASR